MKPQKVIGVSLLTGSILASEARFQFVAHPSRIVAIQSLEQTFEQPHIHKEVSGESVSLNIAVASSSGAYGEYAIIPLESKCGAKFEGRMATGTSMFSTMAIAECPDCKEQWVIPNRLLELRRLE